MKPILNKEEMVAILERQIEKASEVQPEFIGQTVSMLYKELLKEINKKYI